MKTFLGILSSRELVCSVLLIGVVAGGCSHPYIAEENARKADSPSASSSMQAGSGTDGSGARELAGMSGRDKDVSRDHDSSIDEQARSMIARRDQQRVRQILLASAIAQTLVSSFDERVLNLDSHIEVDRVYDSNLYCKIRMTQHSYHREEEKLLAAMSFDGVSSSARAWTYQLMKAYAKSDGMRPAAAKAAMAQLFRMFKNEQEVICKGDVSCDIKSEIKKAMVQDVLGFDPFDDENFLNFMKVNRKSIAAYQKLSADDLKPGKCFNREAARKPNQVPVAGYDWAKRNWVGSALPDGDFVFTYDDGPHAQYTRMIRDAWANAGMPKPTFFWLRKSASNMSSIVDELNGQGYTIGSHSENHADLGTLAKATSFAQIGGVNNTIYGAEIKGLKPQDFEAWKTRTLDREINDSVRDLGGLLKHNVRFFRLPYGSGVRNDLIGQRFQAMNLEHFFWRVDSLDWQDKNPMSIRDRVVQQMKTVKKGIVLFHDTHLQSAQSAQLMVDYLKTNSDRIRAVPMSDLVTE